MFTATSFMRMFVTFFIELNAITLNARVVDWLKELFKGDLWLIFPM